jgi:hypothetical protein
MMQRTVATHFSLLMGLSLCLLFGMTAMAADADDEWFTMKMLNGRGWGHLPDEAAREVYLTGLINGLRYAWVLQGRATSQLNERIYIPPLRLAETRKGIDLFYGDPANSNVPVVLALEVLKMRVDGKTHVEIDKQIEEARRFARDVLEEKNRARQ